MLTMLTMLTIEINFQAVVNGPNRTYAANGCFKPNFTDFLCCS